MVTPVIVTVVAVSSSVSTVLLHKAPQFVLRFVLIFGIRSINFNESAFITAFANDYGYEEWVEKALGFHAKKGDTAILISSSGSSKNLVNAAIYARKNGINVITFTGFSDDNPLKSNGDINFWFNCRSYNIIEGIHQLWLLSVCDLIIGKTEYSVS